ncbi:type II toxin-antitoxin system RelB/DinJ family antitoxin [uncultured Sphingomonas sp.]|uniref:type II toxin-antitoxin system RelB/DinJ family antitoxin n=1 Tax=uncultured Sphingomonas sp. TaxID=158754 RepID=UPI0035C96111
MISIPVDAALEAQAALVLNRIGVTAETAVRLLFVHLAEQGALPDSLIVPNVATQKALADADEMMAQRRRATSPMSASEVGMSNVHDKGDENDDADNGGHK